MPDWLNRSWRFALVLALVLPGLGQLAEAQAPGHVVINWISPAYGFTISYRRDSFVYVSESSTDTGEILNLRSSAGGAIIEAMPADQSIDSCASVALEKQAFAAEQSLVLEPVENGSGVIVTEDTAGNEITHRVDCVLADDDSYLVRYSHSAETSQYGRYASAARAIRESYRPGYPADSDLPPETTHPNGLIEPSLHQIEPSIPPPADSNLVNHPTRFFAIEIAFESLLPVDAIVDGRRAFIPGIGPAISYSWVDGDADFEAPEMVIEDGETAIGRFVFAVPQGTAKVTICYQHLSNNDCTMLFVYDFNAPAESATTYPAIPPLLDPGR